MIKKASIWRGIGIIWMGLGFAQASFALQEKPVTENGEVSAIVAAQDLTRIAVAHDRIVHVRGLEGAYELKQDAAQGALFIRPTLDYQNKPFTLFIATEKNHNYVLHLTPKEQWGDTIVLKSNSPKKFKTVRLKKALSSTKLVTFMRQMVKEDIPPSYVRYNLSHLNRVNVNQELTVQLIRLYAGKPLRGYVYRVTNHSKRTLLLTETKFYQPGDRAISLSQLTLLAGNDVYLYKVRTHG